MVLDCTQIKAAHALKSWLCTHVRKYFQKFFGPLLFKRMITCNALLSQPDYSDQLL